ncbi:MAG: DUF3015 family protein [Nitrospiraceae bacterium]
MNTPVRYGLHLVLMSVLLTALPACTIKATSESLSDAALNFLSSTSGKSFLTQDGLVKRDQHITVFAHINFDNLKQNMAVGHGEYLASFGTLLGVAPGHQAEFFKLTQARYAELFASDRTTPAEMLAALKRELAASPTFQLNHRAT